MDRVTEIKWVDVDNEEGNSAKMHAYYPSQRRVYGALYDSNRALCNRRLGVSENGDTCLPFTELRESPFNEDIACKKCLKIAQSLFLHPIIPNNEK